MNRLYQIRLQHSRTAGSSRSFTAIRKDAGLCCGSRLRKGEVFAYLGLPQNLKDLKDPRKILGLCGRRQQHPKLRVVRVREDSHHQSTLDAVYVFVVPRSEFPIRLSYITTTEIGYFSISCAATVRRHLQGRKHLGPPWG